MHDPPNMLEKDHRKVRETATDASECEAGIGRGIAPEVTAILTQRRDPLDGDQLAAIDAWWRAANYLSVGQIYLLANPLRREPLLPAHSHACSVLGYHSGPEPDLRPLEPGDTQTVT